MNAIKLFRELLPTIAYVWVGGPPTPQAIVQMTRSVDSAAERVALRQQPLQAHARLGWVAKDRGVSEERILAEIAGAKTAIGVILESARGPCMATHLVKVS